MLALTMVALTLLQAAKPVADEPITPPAVVYPAEAKAARIQGTVRLEVQVDPTGHVTAVRALDGPESLRQAAIDAYARAAYRPLMKDGRATPAVVTTSVRFSLSEAPPTTDEQVDRKFQPLHAQCQQLASQRAPGALETCRKAVAMAANFTPQAELEARATAYNYLVLLLIAAGRKSPNLPEAGVLADQAVELIGHASGANPHKPAVAVAYITRAEVRSLANDLTGAADDCAIAEDTLTTLLQDQGKVDTSAAKHDQVEVERAANYRTQLRDTLLLHAIVLDQQHKTKEARLLRNRANAT